MAPERPDPRAIPQEEETRVLETAPIPESAPDRMERLKGALNERAVVAARSLSAGGQQLIERLYSSAPAMAAANVVDRVKIWRQEVLAEGVGAYAGKIERRAQNIENERRALDEAWKKAGREGGVPEHDRAVAQEQVAKENERLESVRGLQQNYETKRAEIEARIRERFQQKIDVNAERAAALQEQRDALSQRAKHDEELIRDQSEVAKSFEAALKIGSLEKDAKRETEEHLASLHNNIRELEDRLSLGRAQRADLDDRIAKTEQRKSNYERKAAEVLGEKRGEGRAESASPDAAKKPRSVVKETAGGADEKESEKRQREAPASDAESAANGRESRTSNLELEVWRGEARENLLADLTSEGYRRTYSPAEVTDELRQLLESTLRHGSVAEDGEFLDKVLQALPEGQRSGVIAETLGRLIGEIQGEPPPWKDKELFFKLLDELPEQEKEEHAELFLKRYKEVSDKDSSSRESGSDRREPREPSGEPRSEQPPGEPNEKQPRVGNRGALGGLRDILLGVGAYLGGAGSRGLRETAGRLQVTGSGSWRVAKWPLGGLAFLLLGAARLLEKASLWGLKEINNKNHPYVKRLTNPAIRWLERKPGGK